MVNMDFFSEIVGETIVLGVDTLIIGFCLTQLGKCKHILNALQSAPVLDIDASLHEEVKKYSNETIPYVVIRGLVKPLGSPIVSNYNKTVTGVVQRWADDITSVVGRNWMRLAQDREESQKKVEAYTQQWVKSDNDDVISEPSARLKIKEHVIARTSAGSWSNQTRTIHEVCNSSPFELTNGRHSIEVIDALAAELLDMDVISDKFEPLSPGVIDHIWGFFSGVRQRGIQTIEEMLRDGSYITAIGELSRSNTGALKIQPPKEGLPLYLTTSTKSSLVNRLTSNKSFLRFMLVVFGSVAAAASCRVVYKWVRRRRRRAHDDSLKKQLAAGRRERRAIAREKNLTDVQLCVVCTENPKEIILLPCGHVCLCEDCSDNIHDNCPVCREHIQTRAPAFIT